MSFHLHLSFSFNHEQEKSEVALKSKAHRHELSSGLLPICIFSALENQCIYVFYAHR